MSIISASTTTTTAYSVTGDTTGTLVFKTGASPTTAMTIGSDQSVTFAGAQTYTGPATFTSGITVQGVTVGRGAGAVSTNTAVGASALALNAGAGALTFIGYQAGYNTTTGGGSGTGIGYNVLYSNTTGGNNTALGREALYSNTTASANTAVGYQSLYFNNASNCTAVGYGALYTNSSGENEAFGLNALRLNTTGTANNAVGRDSLSANTTGSYNTALGRGSLQSNTTAVNNTAVGYQAGYSQTTFGANTFIGYQAGYTQNNTASYTYNTFVGYQAGYSTTTAVKCTILGGFNGNQGGLDIRTASNYIVLSDGDGNPRLWINGANAVLVVPSAYSSTTASAANLNIDSGGGITRSTSALKYKQDIRDVEDFDISALRPVRYKSKCENDDQTKDHLGLIADEAAAAGFEELVTRGADGEVEGFQYERLTVVLLKKLQVLEAEVKALKGQA